MTTRKLEKETQIAALVVIRDWAEREAFYYRRRGTDSHDRTLAIELEAHARSLEDVIGNLRAELVEDRRGSEVEA